VSTLARKAASPPERQVTDDTPMLLVKTLTLGLALLSMNAFIAASAGLADPSEPVIWGAVIAVSLAWLVLALRRMREPSGSWLRPSIWT
jgi:predicted PurR-regulated permease PerM